MSQARNLIGFLNSNKKFNQSDRKRSLSRNGSQKSLTNFKTSTLKKGSQQNAEQPYTKRTKKYEDDEDSLYQQRDYRNPLRKVKSIESSTELFGRKHTSKLSKEESDEDEYESAQNYHHTAKSAENFQASRKEAKFFIESLARKINIQIENINNTVDEFNKNFRRTVEVEYAKLKAAIVNVVEEMFESQQENIKNLAKAEIRSVNQQLTDVRSELELMYGKLQKIKEGLEGPNWKKVTGEILSGEIEANVMELIKKSEKTKILRNVKIVSDIKKEEAFTSALEDLLQVNLVSGLDHNHSFGITVL